MQEEQKPIERSQTTIVIDQALLNKIHSHAISIYPEECCGLMLGSFDDGSVKKVNELKEMENTYAPEEKYHRYTIDPKAFMKAENDANERGMEIVGIYHSHPNAPSKPSTFDQSHAWPTLSYVVVEVREKKPISTRSWVLKEDRSDFLQEVITVAGISPANDSDSKK